MPENRVVFFEQQVYKIGNFCNPGPLHAGKYCHYWKPINAPSQKRTLLISKKQEALMKIGKRIIWILSVFLVLVTLSISVSADGVNQTPEIQGITTTTYIDVVGSASNVVDLAWTSSSGSMQDNPPLSDSEVVQTTVYSEDTNAMNGHTVYVKDFALDTGNKAVSQSNVESNRQITFEGLNGGNMVSDESLLINTVGMPTSAAGQFLCPFGASSTSTIPAYCNIVQAGSHVDSQLYLALNSGLQQDCGCNAGCTGGISLQHQCSRG